MTLQLFSPRSYMRVTKAASEDTVALDEAKRRAGMVLAKMCAAQCGGPCLGACHRLSCGSLLKSMPRVLSSQLTVGAPVMEAQLIWKHPHIIPTV